MTLLSHIISFGVGDFWLSHCVSPKICMVIKSVSTTRTHFIGMKEINIARLLEMFNPTTNIKADKNKL